MKLVRPAAEHLPSYVAALAHGWSADNVRGAVAAREELAQIEADPQDYLAWMDDVQARGPLVTLPDGSRVARIPGLRRWMWDNSAAAVADQAFIGSINLRWLPDNAPLPPHVLGHIGYAVVPWHSGRGHGTGALAQLLPLARAQGLRFVELTTDPENLPSQAIITKNGGVLTERFNKGASYLHKPGLRYRIDL